MAEEPEDIDDAEDANAALMMRGEAVNGDIEKVEKKTKKRLKKEELQRLQELEDIRALAKYPQFRDLMWRILSKAGVYHENFAASPLPMAKQEGKRAMGLWLLMELLTAEPNLYTQMRNEAVSRDTV